MITRDDLKILAPETIELLHRNGELAHLLAEPEPAGDKVSRADLRNMAPEEISRLRRSGDLAHLTKPETDDAKVARWKAEAAEAQAGEPAPPAGTAVDQGARGTQSKTGRARLKGMTPAQIVEAHRRGDLDDLMNGRVR